MRAILPDPTGLEILLKIFRKIKREKTDGSGLRISICRKTVQAEVTGVRFLAEAQTKNAEAQSYEGIVVSG